MRVTVHGAGAVGARLARALLAHDDVEALGVVEPDAGRRSDVLDALADDRVVDGPLDATDVSALALPAGEHVALAEAAIAQGAHVVSTSDDVGEVRALLALHGAARAAGTGVVVGAAFSPGLTCLLAVHASRGLARVDEVHVARVGVGGPACDRQQQRSLHGLSVDWRDEQWIERPGGAGREQCWFPDPIGGVDCFRAARPEAMLLVPLFPDVQRVTARLGTATSNPLRARIVGRRRVPADGPPGAVRVEVRGTSAHGEDAVVLGCMDRASVAASAVAAEAVLASGRGRLRRAGAGGAAELLDVLETLQALHESGVRAARFEGAEL